MKLRRRKHVEEPHRSRGRGAKLIRANHLRGMGASVRAGSMGVYVTDRSRDKPNTLQGTRR